MTLPTKGQLTEYVMGEIAGRKRRQIDRRLARCKPCQARTREREALAGAIQNSQAENAGGPGPRVTFQALPARTRRDGRRERQQRAAVRAIGSAVLVVLVLALLQSW